jgi:hypothetical protein
MSVSLKEKRSNRNLAIYQKAGEVLGNEAAQALYSEEIPIVVCEKEKTKMHGEA